jgi:hypothetical protein
MSAAISLLEAPWLMRIALLAPVTPAREIPAAPRLRGLKVVVERSRQVVHGRDIVPFVASTEIFALRVAARATTCGRRSRP